MKRVIQAVLISTAVLSFSAMAANYGPVSSKNPGYLVDSSGSIIKSARTGQCVRLARQWSSSNADRGCMSTLQSGGR
jgi:hypothetical protein